MIVRSNTIIRGDNGRSGRVDASSQGGMPIYQLRVGERVLEQCVVDGESGQGGDSLMVSLLLPSLIERRP